MDSLILTTIIATLFIIGLNVFLFREKIHDLLDVHAMWASDFSKSVCVTFLAIILIYLVGFFVGAFSNPTVNALIFFGTITGMVFAIYGMGLKKRWFMFFWLGVVVSSLVITIQQIDPYTIPFSIWSLVLMGLMWMNLHYYNKEKSKFYI
jgi:uncharacterized Tic20 family protein